MSLVQKVVSASIAVSSSEVTILSIPCELMGSVGIYLENTGGNALTDVNIYHGLDAANAIATADDINTGDISTVLAAGATGFFGLTINTHIHLEVRATAGSGDTTLECTVKGLT